MSYSLFTFFSKGIDFIEKSCIIICVGDVAQLGEHQVRNLGVEGSIPFVSTNNTNVLYTLCMQFDIYGSNRQQYGNVDVFYYLLQNFRRCVNLKDMIDRIVFDDVNLSFGDKNIFEGVSIELGAGKVITIVGANGSGKSTFLKLAGQFIKPSTGTVTAFDGEVPIECIDFRKKIAAIAPSMNLYSELTAVENINFFVGLRDIHLHDSDIEALFKRVGLSIGDKDKYLSNFSTGMIQRLKFAVLLAVETDVWLLDEPGSNLDGEGKSIILSEVRRAADTGKLILLATNDRDEMEAADEIISLPII